MVEAETVKIAVIGKETNELAFVIQKIVLFLSAEKTFVVTNENLLVVYFLVV